MIFFPFNACGNASCWGGYNSLIFHFSLNNLTKSDDSPNSSIVFFGPPPESATNFLIIGRSKGCRVVSSNDDTQDGLLLQQQTNLLPSHRFFHLLPESFSHLLYHHTDRLQLLLFLTWN